ncbi:GFA family protein [Shewanella waksmanii]|uniref:GFA family protein n=1 Tax=Shewanella waksmanii TaxID=213783 RepID=UPI00048B641F|nr:GFA family protein [Shewanella waksmanii]
MTTNNIILTGGCLCGALRYQTTAQPFDSDHCHCTVCQKSTGAAVGSWMDFKRAQVTWIQGQVTEYASSDTIRRGFCHLCGSTLSYRSTDYPDYYTLSITSLDDANQVKPKYHIHTASAVSWLVIDDELPRYANARSSD